MIYHLPANFGHCNPLQFFYDCWITLHARTSMQKLQAAAACIAPFCILLFNKERFNGIHHIRVRQPLYSLMNAH